MNLNAAYTALNQLDKEVHMLCLSLSGTSTADPEKRIIAAEAILMLQHDRKAMVAEIMTQMYGSTK
jgi:hypothetical protein